MFLLSSEDFYQAYKRLQYMKQYTDFRKSQGEQIGVKADELNVLTQEGIARQIAEGVEYPFIVITPQISNGNHAYSSYYQFIGL